MNTNDEVKFVYLQSGQAPATPDAGTVYFNPTTKDISVGDVAFQTLPSASTSDNGKVLSVVDGAWTKAQPSGGESPIAYIDCELNSAGDKLVFATAPYNTIKNLYLSNKYIILRVTQSSSILLVPCVEVGVGFTDNPTFKFCFTAAMGGALECYYTEMYEGLESATEFDWYMVEV